MDHVSLVFASLVPDAESEAIPADERRAFSVCSREDVARAIVEYVTRATEAEPVLPPLLQDVLTTEEPLRRLSSRLQRSRHALRLWVTALNNILEHPGDEKYRRIKVGGMTFVAMSSSNIVPDNLRGHPEPTMVSLEAAANSAQVTAVLCDSLGFSLRGDANTRHVVLPFEAPLAPLQAALVAALERQSIVERHAGLVSDALSAVDAYRAREVARAERAVIRWDRDNEEVTREAKQAFVSHTQQVLEPLGLPIFNQVALWDDIVAATQWLLSSSNVDWASRRPLGETEAAVVTGLFRAILPSLQPPLRSSEKGEARLTWRAFILPLNPSQRQLAEHLLSWASAERDRCVVEQMRLERITKAAANVSKGAPMPATPMPEREKDLQTVGTSLIASIAAVMHRHWELSGAVGYVAEDRREAQRLHTEFRRGSLTVADLHRLHDVWCEKLEALQRQQKHPR